MKCLINQGVNVFFYTLAGKNSNVVDLVIKNIAVKEAKKRKRTARGNMVICETTHVSNYRVIWEEFSC